MSRGFPAFFSNIIPGVALLICSVYVNAYSGQSSLHTFLGQVEAKAVTVRSFKCDFRQERHLSIFPQPVIFSGQLLLERPDRLRWEFVEPIPSALILNGRAGIKCEPRGKELVFSLDNDPVMKIVARQLWSWTGGSYRDLADDFDMQLSPGSVLVLSPTEKSAGNFISKITVRFDPETLQPVQVSIEEPGGDRTELFFTKYKTNIKIPGTMFTGCRNNSDDDQKD